MTVAEVGPRTLSALGVVVPVRTARIAVGGLLVVALLTAAAAMGLSASGRSGAAESLLTRDAGRILRVSSFTPGRTVVEVADAEALHRVAVRFDALVLHCEDPLADTFAVQDGDTTYRYIAPRAVVPTRAVTPVLVGRPA